MCSNVNSMMKVKFLSRVLLYLSLFLIGVFQVAYGQSVVANSNIIDNSNLPDNIKHSYASLSAIKYATGQFKRHGITGYCSSSIDNKIVDKVSERFEVSETDVGIDGSPVTAGSTVTMNWAKAIGFSSTDLDNANTDPTLPLPTPLTGCAAYGGINGGEQGQWRLPTHKEWGLIVMLNGKLKKGVQLTSSAASLYWASTENNNKIEGNPSATVWCLCTTPDIGVSSYFFYVNNTSYKTSNGRVRCIKDLAP